MTITYSKFFDPVVVGTVPDTLLTVPALPVTTLLRGGRVRLTNTTSAAVAVSLYAVPPSGVPLPSNSFLSGASIPANNYMDVDVPIMPAGSFVQAESGVAASITAHMISGSLFS